jgi:hypothetical protein
MIVATIELAIAVAAVAAAAAADAGPAALLGEEKLVHPSEEQATTVQDEALA